MTPPNLFRRFTESLQKTRARLSGRLAALIRGRKTLDKALLAEIEEILLSADLGVEVTHALIQDLTTGLAQTEPSGVEVVYQRLKTKMAAMLMPCEQPFRLPETPRPFVILVAGVNGVGKTTTLAKLAYHFQRAGAKTLLAACDTFRAAAIDQLRVWADRHQTPLIAQQPGSDSASVLYDALQAARARGCEVLLGDTAGRLHTQGALMQEFQKMLRVLRKLDPTAPHESLLVLDATTGQNALAQAQAFQAVLPLTGLVVTKLDGTAKGGILFAIAQKLKLPIRFIGVGEGIEDLRVFQAQAFIQAVFEDEPSGFGA